MISKKKPGKIYLAFCILESLNSLLLHKQKLFGFNEAACFDAVEINAA